MNKEQFLDVNGFNSEYDIPLEKRLNKYRKRGQVEVPRTSAAVPVVDRLAAQSEAWRAEMRRKQVITAFVAALVFVAVVAASVFLTYGM